MIEKIKWLVELYEKLNKNEKFEKYSLIFREELKVLFSKEIQKIVDKELDALFWTPISRVSQKNKLITN